MKILFTGYFDPEYNRTKVIINGLELLGADIRLFPFPKKKKPEIHKLKEAIDDADWVFMPSFTHTDLPFVKRISNKPIIFDPLISRYLSKVFDYKSVWKYSPRAYKNYLKDSRALKRADLILADTESHKKYFMEKFSVKADKIRVIPIGVITEDFFPIKAKAKEDNKIIVGFYGSFIPLHGIDIIINAAEILKEEKNIVFKLIGNGILFDTMKKMAESKSLNNIVFEGWKPYSELNLEINNFDICLGIFGESIKAKMVVPNKLFHYAACKKAIISRTSEAITEIFKHNINISLCEPSPAGLASAIRLLTEDSERARIAKNAYDLIRRDFNQLKIAENILDFMEA
ncbi:MAG: glycosyltransferase [Bacteroidales bacterium]|nr:glycosyltransferase [Bacteroidales bacterium]MCF8389308.1 glycosyltransferase [Bacteroidales bacterium]